jgi:hypothetical protein
MRLSRASVASLRCSPDAMWLRGRPIASPPTYPIMSRPRERNAAPAPCRSIDQVKQLAGRKDQKQREERDSLLDVYLQAIKGTSRVAKGCVARGASRRTGTCNPNALGDRVAPRHAELVNAAISLSLGANNLGTGQMLHYQPDQAFMRSHGSSR